jgi:hypothetical protein
LFGPFTRALGNGDRSDLSLPTVTRRRRRIDPLQPIGSLHTLRAAVKKIRSRKGARLRV